MLLVVSAPLQAHVTGDAEHMALMARFAREFAPAQIAYALDGYPIYGESEPDGSPPQRLDAFNGHETASLGYHYHASNKYPYVNGGFHGVVVEREEP